MNNLLRQLTDDRKLILYANLCSLERLYQAPIMLCGSGVYKTNPRDWDLRITLPDDKFKKHFNLSAKSFTEQGKTGKWTTRRYEWGEYCAKLSKRLSKALNLNIDFQIYPEFMARQYNKEERIIL